MLAFVFFVALCACLASPSLSAAQRVVAPDREGPRAASAEREPPSGAEALVASASYPGLGQLLNGAETKAVAVSAVEALLVCALVVEDRRTRNSLRLYKQTGEEAYYDDYSEHYDRRQTLVWWVAVAALYGLADAYVDAHLTGFEDEPVARVETSVGGDGSDPGEFRVGLAVRF